jgi:para-nitrobenzyl esterase
MVDYWTNFARSSDPNSPGMSLWPLYGSSDQFQSLRPPMPATGTGFAIDHKCAFWGLN